MASVRALYLTTEDLSRKTSSGKVHFRALVHELAKLGHVVTVVAPKFDRDSQVVCESAAAIESFLVPKNALGLFLFELKLLAAVPRLQQRYQPDVVLVRGGGPGWILGLVFATFRLFGIAVVLECNGISWEEFRRRGFPRPIQWQVHFSGWQQARMANRIIGVSDEITSAYARLGGKSDAQATTIPNGVDPQAFAHRLETRQQLRRRLGIGDRLLVVGYVGSFSPWHDVLSTIASASLLQDRKIDDVVFLLIGDGEQLPAVRERCQELDLRNVVFFGAAEDRNQLTELCACFDVGLCTNIQMDGSPLKFFEYLALGIPVVASGCPQVTDIIGRERAGKVVPASSPVELADVVAEIAAERDKWSYVGKRNQELAQTYSWRKVAEKVVEVLHPGARDRDS